MELLNNNKNNNNEKTKYINKNNNVETNQNESKLSNAKASNSKSNSQSSAKFQQHPFLIKSSKQRSEDTYVRSLSSKNGNKNFNAQAEDEEEADKKASEKTIYLDAFSNRKKCSINEDFEDRNPFNMSGMNVKYYDCNQAANKMKHFNHIFYNGTSNHVERNGQEFQTHAADLLKFLSSLWITRTMCDLILRIENRKYHAHRLALAMFSRRYYEEFQKQGSKSDDIYTIRLTNTTDIALEAILTYIYTANIDINPSNADAILKGAKELGIDSLICMTQDYLTSLSIGDILIYMRNINDKEDGEYASYQIYSYIMKNLDKISRTCEYEKADLYTVKILLSDSYLQIDSEAEVFDAAMRWVKYDKKRRYPCIVEIMRCVRFTLMTPIEIHNRTEKYSIFFEEKELLLMLLNAYKYHAFVNYNDSENSPSFINPEEERNLDLNGSSMPENFSVAINNLSLLATQLKNERTKNINGCFENLNIQNTINNNDSSILNFVPVQNNCRREGGNCCGKNCCGDSGLIHELKSNSLNNVAHKKGCCENKFCKNQNCCKKDTKNSTKYNTCDCENKCNHDCLHVTNSVKKFGDMNKCDHCCNFNCNSNNNNKNSNSNNNNNNNDAIMSTTKKNILKDDEVGYKSDEYDE